MITSAGVERRKESTIENTEASVPELPHVQSKQDAEEVGKRRVGHSPETPHAVVACGILILRREEHTQTKTHATYGLASFSSSEFLVMHMVRQLIQQGASVTTVLRSNSGTSTSIYGAEPALWMLTAHCTLAAELVLSRSLPSPAD